jgi:hypothetical protein
VGTGNGAMSREPHVVKCKKCLVQLYRFLEEIPYMNRTNREDSGV